MEAPCQAAEEADERTAVAVEQPKQMLRSCHWTTTISQRCDGPTSQQEMDPDANLKNLVIAAAAAVLALRHSQAAEEHALRSRFVAPTVL